MGDYRKLKGKFYVRAGGQVLAMAADAEITVKKGAVKRTPVPMNDGSVGYTEEPVPASIAASFRLLQGMTLEELQNMTDVTVTAEADDGWSGTIANAFCAGDLSMGKGGEVKVEYFGAALDEQTGAI